MPSTYSPALRLELIGNGEQAANWGNTTNTNLGTLLEQAITGVGNITMLDANYTLISGNGVSDEARNAVLVVTGTLSATRSLIVPTSNKFYAVRNATTGGQSILIRTSGGTGVTLANGFTQLMYCDGTNVVLASVPVNATTGGVVLNNATLNNPTINGFTGDTSVINVGSGQFYKATGGNVGIGTSSPATQLHVNGVGFTGITVSSNSTSETQLRFATNTAARITNQSNTALLFDTNAIERMRIDASGNVGIGTGSPGSRLQVNGTIAASDGSAAGGALALGNSINSVLSASSATLLTLNSAGYTNVSVNGNVGLGTASPTQRLDVSGNTNISGNLVVGGNISVAGTGLFPPGVIMEYGGASAPSGWLICDGSQVSRSVYAALFAVIGTAYGAGDGSTTFNLPNRVNRFGVGAGGSYALGSTGGATSATTSSAGAHNHTGLTGGTAITTAQMPSHTHTGTTSTNGNHSHDFNGLTAPVQGSGFGYNIGTGTTTGSITGTNTTGAHNHTFTTDATGGGAAHDHSISTDGTHTHTVATVPPYVASNYIIKT